MTTLFHQNELESKNLESNYFTETRNKTALFSSVQKILDPTEEQNLSSHAYTIVPSTKDLFVWSKISEYNEILMSNINFINENIYIMSSCIEHEESKDIPKIMKNINTWKKWSDFAANIVSKQVQMNEFPSDSLAIILNFWHAMLYFYFDDEEYVIEIEKIINKYREKNGLIGDDECFEKNKISLSYEEKQKAEKFEKCKQKWQENYNNPSIIKVDSNCSCGSVIHGEIYICDYCKKKPTFFRCKSCFSFHHAEHEELCYECYMQNKKDIFEENNYILKATINIENNKTIESWIIENHNLTTIGRPCIQLAIIKDSSTNKTNDIIIDKIHSLIKNCEVVTKNFNRSKNKAVSSICFSWKNIENLYCITMTTTKHRKCIARTVFTKLGCNYFHQFNKLINDYKNTIKEYNPCTTLETTFQLTNNLLDQPEIINKPVEYNESLQATDVIVKILLKEQKYINKDNMVWEKVKGTKMTFRNTERDVDSVINKISFQLGREKDLVKSQINEIKNALTDDGIDEVLITPVPRITMTYRMIELKDGFYDIIHKCIYKDQNQFACWIYCPTISIDDIYNLLETKLLNRNNLYWETSITFGVFYIEYFADLYQQHLPRFLYNNIFCQVSDNLPVLLYLISPMVCIYPIDLHCEVSETFSKVKKAYQDRTLNPILYSSSSLKLIEENIIANKRGLLKSGSYHLNKQDPYVDENEAASIMMQRHFLVKHHVTDLTPITDIDEAIYIILFTGLCSFAKDNKWDRLYKFPVYNTMPKKNIDNFNMSMQFLFGKKLSFRECIPTTKTELAFAEDKISLKDNIIKPSMNDILPIKNIEHTPIQNNALQAKKKIGRPKKEVSTIPIIKKAVGRPPKYQKEDPFPKIN